MDDEDAAWASIDLPTYVRHLAIIEAGLQLN
jgi:hypothetical protein